MTIVPILFHLLAFLALFTHLSLSLPWVIRGTLVWWAWAMLSLFFMLFLSWLMTWWAVRIRTWTVRPFRAQLFTLLPTFIWSDFLEFNLLFFMFPFIWFFSVKYRIFLNNLNFRIFFYFIDFSFLQGLILFNIILLFNLFYLRNNNFTISWWWFEGWLTFFNTLFFLFVKLWILPLSNWQFIALLCLNSFIFFLSLILNSPSFHLDHSLYHWSGVCYLSSWWISFFRLRCRILWPFRPTIGKPLLFFDLSNYFISNLLLFWSCLWLGLENLTRLPPWFGNCLNFNGNSLFAFKRVTTRKHILTLKLSFLHETSSVELSLDIIGFIRSIMWADTVNFWVPSYFP